MNFSLLISVDIIEFQVTMAYSSLAQKVYYDVINCHVEKNESYPRKLTSFKAEEHTYSTRR
jgi:hypothetical protein